MIRHLTPVDYTTMPWANGKGVTVEMMRVDRDGGLLWRLSRASVVEEGAFSLFPGIERNLTVISGPGFDLQGAAGILPARPLVPVAFPGDVDIRAVAVSTPSDDFNVMTARHLPRPDVSLVQQGQIAARGQQLCLFCLGDAVVNGEAAGCHDLFLADQDLQFQSGGPALLVRLSL